MSETEAFIGRNLQSTRACERRGCGTMFPVRVGRGPFAKRFCSPSCRKMAHEEQRKAAADPPEADRGAAISPRRGEDGPVATPVTGTVTARPGAAAAEGSRAAPRLPDALPDRVERPFTTQQRDDGASDPAALRPVKLPWENATAP